VFLIAEFRILRQATGADLDEFRRIPTSAVRQFSNFASRKSSLSCDVVVGHGRDVDARNAAQAQHDRRRWLGSEPTANNGQAGRFPKSIAIPVAEEWASHAFAEEMASHAMGRAAIEQASTVRRSSYGLAAVCIESIFGHLRRWRNASARCTPTCPTFTALPAVFLRKCGYGFW